MKYLLTLILGFTCAWISPAYAFRNNLITTETGNVTIMLSNDMLVVGTPDTKIECFDITETTLEKYHTVLSQAANEAYYKPNMTWESTSTIECPVEIKTTHGQVYLTWKTSHGPQVIEQTIPVEFVEQIERMFYVSIHPSDFIETDTFDDSTISQMKTDVISHNVGGGILLGTSFAGFGFGLANFAAARVLHYNDYQGMLDPQEEKTKITGGILIGVGAVAFVGAVACFATARQLDLEVYDSNNIAMVLSINGLAIVGKW